MSTLWATHFEKYRSIKKCNENALNLTFNMLFEKDENLS